MISDLLKKIFGDKTAKDRKEYQPMIDKSNQFFDEFKSLTDDDLRNKTLGFRSRVSAHIEKLETELKELNQKAIDPATPINEKEELFEAIDKLTKTIDDQIEDILLEIMPEAFAVVKETARRWAENGQLEVTASALDKELSTKKDGIRIEGEKAIWLNSWTAAGAEVKWNMVHYDVQLMGGGVLHRGRIAEMQTGEGKTLVAT